jgi:hypothetical protein
MRKWSALNMNTRYPCQRPKTEARRECSISVNCFLQETLMPSTDHFDSHIRTARAKDPTARISKGLTLDEDYFFTIHLWITRLIKECWEIECRGSYQYRKITRVQMFTPTAQWETDSCKTLCEARSRLLSASAEVLPGAIQGIRATIWFGTTTGTGCLPAYRAEITTKPRKVITVSSLFSFEAIGLMSCLPRIQTALRIFPSYEPEFLIMKSHSS